MTNQPLSTGFPAIDKITGGLLPGKLYVIAGRSGVGKSALAMNIAEHVVFDEGVSVAVFNQKMPAHHILRRLLRSRARATGFRIHGTTINKEEPLDSTAASTLSNMALFVDDTTGMTIEEIKIRARRLHSDEGVKLVVIDYLQLLRGENPWSQVSMAEQAEISHGCKTLAGELAVPVIVLCALPMFRCKGNRPALNDLCIWAGLENEADVVWLISRDKYEPEGQRPTNEENATLIIAKQPNGRAGDVLLTYLNNHTRFVRREDGMVRGAPNCNPDFPGY